MEAEKESNSTTLSQPTKIRSRCITCGDFKCQFWFHGPTNVMVNNTCVSVEGHINHSMVRRLVYDVSSRYIGAPIIVSPGFRNNEDLGKFLTQYKKTKQYEPLSFDLYYIHYCSIVPQLNGYFLSADSLIRIFTSYTTYIGYKQ